MLSLRTLVYFLAMADTALSAALAAGVHAGANTGMGRHSRERSRKGVRQQTTLNDRPLAADGCQNVAIKIPTKVVDSGEALLVSRMRVSPQKISILRCYSPLDFGTKHLSVHTKRAR